MTNLTEGIHYEWIKPVKLPFHKAYTEAQIRLQFLMYFYASNQG